MEQLTSGALAVAMIAAFVLVIAGVKLALVRETRSRGVLMVIAALVLVGNVAVMTI